MDICEFPRVLHQFCFSGEDSLSKNSKISAKTWKTTNPDFSYILWDSDSIKKLIKTKYPWFFDTWLDLSSEKEWENVARILVLDSFGGVFANKDSWATREIEPILKQFDLTEYNILIGETSFQNPVERIIRYRSLNFNKKLLGTSVVISKNCSSSWKPLLESIKNKVQAKKQDKLVFTPSFITESHIGGEADITNHLQLKDFKEETFIVPYHFFEGHSVPDSQKEELEMAVYSKNFLSESSLLPNELKETLGPSGERYFINFGVVLVLSLLLILLERYYGLSTAILGLFMLGVLVSLCWVTSIHGARCSEINRDPLEDVWFRIIPFSLKGNDFLTKVIHVFPTLVIYGFVINMLTRERNDERLRLAFLLSLVCLYTIRASCQALTCIPSPIREKDVQDGMEEAFQASHKQTFGESPILNDHDMMFSGHTSSFVLGICWWFFIYMRNDDTFSYLGQFLLFLVFSGSLIAMRLHYSMDIAVGFFMGLLIFMVSKSWYVNKNIPLIGSDISRLTFSALVILASCITANNIV